MTDTHAILEKVSHLIDQELWQSAEFLCSGIISSKTLSVEIKAQATEYLADTYFHRKEFRRATNYYGRCITLLKSCGSIEGYGTTLMVRVTMKKSKSFMALNENSNAIQEIELIPMKQRTIQVHMTLGRLYQSSKLKRLAVNSFKAVLAAEPFASEVYELLISLGVDYSELMPFIKDGINRSTDGGVEAHLQGGVWLESLVKTLMARQLSDFEGCLKECNHLKSVMFPENSVYLLRVLGQVSSMTNKPNDACDYYRKVRKLDEACLDSMDDFGMLLYDGRQEAELNKLANELIAIDDTRETGWLVAAMYCALKDEADKAKQLVDRVIQMRPLSSCAYNFKGKLLINNGHTDQAIIAFLQANVLHRDVRTMSNLVSAQLAANKVKEATNTARDAVSLCPKVPTSHILLGQCLVRSSTASVVQEGINCFHKALELDKAHVLATAMLAEAYAVQDKHHEAVACLLGTLECSPSAEANSLRMQLARCYVRLENYSAAMEQLHMVIELDPDSGDAVLELERLETELGGHN